MDTLNEGILLGIGNPLLDISAYVDDALLNKYNLKADDAIMAEEEHLPLYKELVDCHQAEFIAGGSVQNSLRVAQWIWKKPKVSTYFGCVGMDEFADKLKENAIKEGVNVKYQVTDRKPTGTCAVLITGTHRSLCANLAAATEFTEDHLHIPENRKLIEASKYIYASGFFLAVNPPSLLHLAKLSLQKGHTFIMNLSAPFVSSMFKKELEQLLPYVDVLFGNETEALSFAKEFELGDKDLKTIGMKLSKFAKHNENRKRVVVLTQGYNPVLVAHNDTITEIPVHKLEKEEIVDTNGAGDAFTGGFLSQLVLGESYETCVKCGIYAATEVIRSSGCTFRGESNFQV